MMWKYSTYILLILNISLLAIIYVVNNKYNEERSLLIKKVNKLSFESFSLQNNIILSKQGNHPLNPNTLLYNKEGDSILLSELDRNDYTLVLRYSTQSCSTCVENILDKILKFGKQHPDIDLLLLTTYRTQRDEALSQKAQKAFTKVYSVFSLGLPLEDDVIPYLFILDKELRVVDTFIPVKELPDLTQRYLDNISTKSY